MDRYSDQVFSLDVNGVWVLEQSYMPRMLELNSYDTICHEHLEYYALSQIERLVEENGLRVTNVEFSAINGGSFRLYVCHVGSAHSSRDDVLATLREQEEKAGLFDFQPYSEFRERVFRLRDELHRFISEEVSSGKRIHLYGASTKGNTILQFCKLAHRLIEAAADRNPDKWNALTPATGIPIISEEESRSAKPDYYLVLPWHFRDEFLQREIEFRDAGGRLIFPLPEMEIV